MIDFIVVKSYTGTTSLLEVNSAYKQQDALRYTEKLFDIITKRQERRTSDKLKYIVMDQCKKVFYQCMDVVFVAVFASLEESPVSLQKCLRSAQRVTAIISKGVKEVKPDSFKGQLISLALEDCLLGFDGEQRLLKKAQDSRSIRQMRDQHLTERFSDKGNRDIYVRNSKRQWKQAQVETNPNFMTQHFFSEEMNFALNDGIIKLSSESIYNKPPTRSPLSRRASQRDGSKIVEHHSTSKGVLGSNNSLQDDILGNLSGINMSAISKDGEEEKSSFDGTSMLSDLGRKGNSSQNDSELHLDLSPFHSRGGVDTQLTNIKEESVDREKMQAADSIGESITFNPMMGSSNDLQGSNSHILVDQLVGVESINGLKVGLVETLQIILQNRAIKQSRVTGKVSLLNQGQIQVPENQFFLLTDPEKWADESLVQKIAIQNQTDLILQDPSSVTQQNLYEIDYRSQNKNSVVLTYHFATDDLTPQKLPLSVIYRVTTTAENQQVEIKLAVNPNCNEALQDIEVHLSYNPECSCIGAKGNPEIVENRVTWKSKRLSAGQRPSLFADFPLSVPCESIVQNIRVKFTTLNTNFSKLAFSLVDSEKSHHCPALLRSNAEYMVKPQS